MGEEMALVIPMTMIVVFGAVMLCIFLYSDYKEKKYHQQDAIKH